MIDAAIGTYTATTELRDRPGEPERFATTYTARGIGRVAVEPGGTTYSLIVYDEHGKCSAQYTGYGTHERATRAARNIIEDAIRARLEAPRTLAERIAAMDYRRRRNATT